jgi:cysteine desulfurase
MTLDKPIYLDNNATTPCDPLVVEKMLPFFTETYGNPSNGLHRQGRMAAKAVEDAREQIAILIGAQPNEIFFTGGATESDNLAIFGITRLQKNNPKKQIISSQIEHKAVLYPCKKLMTEGIDVVFLSVDNQGSVNVDQALEGINPDTLLVSIHLANNEIGTIQPVKKIAEFAHRVGAIVHSDAAQAVGKIHVNVNDLDVDLLSFSSHKIYGPKGVGALFIRGGLRANPLEPLVYGGGQEKGIRSGTTNVSGIVGFGEAAKITQKSLSEEGLRINDLRNIFEKGLLSEIPGLIINGYNATLRLPNTSSLTFPKIDADALLLNLPDVMLGTGSACTSGTIEPSHVLQAIGLTRGEAQSTIRASLGRFTTHEQITIAIKLLVSAFKSLVS